MCHLYRDQADLEGRVLTGGSGRVGPCPVVRDPLVEQVWLRLVVALADVDGPVPCQQHPEVWFADDPRDVAAAEALCRGCPVVRACRDYADVAGERHGTWGGRDRRPRRGRRRRRATASDATGTVPGATQRKE